MKSNLTAKELLDGLIDLVQEDSKGNFRVILDYDNYQDGARILNGDGDVIGESYNLGEQVDSDISKQQFIEALEIAIRENTGQRQKTN